MGTSATSELACDPSMSLQIEGAQLLRTLVTSGYIEGASSDNKEEQAMQERERKRRELSRQQFVCVERLKQITIFERDCIQKILANAQFVPSILEFDTMNLRKKTREECLQY